MPVFTYNGCAVKNHETACGLYEPGFYKIVNPAGPPPGNEDYLGISVELGRANTEDIVIYNHNMGHDINYLELTYYEYLRLMTRFRQQSALGIDDYDVSNKISEREIEESFDQVITYMRDNGIYCDKFVAGQNNSEFLAWHLKVIGKLYSMPGEIIRRFRNTLTCQPEKYEPFVLSSHKLLVMEYDPKKGLWELRANRSCARKRKGDNLDVLITAREADALCGVLCEDIDWLEWVHEHMPLSKALPHYKPRRPVLQTRYK